MVEKNSATSDWDECGKALNASYSIVPMGRLSKMVCSDKIISYLFVMVHGWFFA